MKNNMMKLKEEVGGLHSLDYMAAMKNKKKDMPESVDGVSGMSSFCLTHAARNAERSGYGSKNRD